MLILVIYVDLLRFLFAQLLQQTAAVCHNIRVGSACGAEDWQQNSVCLMLWQHDELHKSSQVHCVVLTPTNSY